MAGVNVFHDQEHAAAGEIEPQVVACDQSRRLRSRNEITARAPKKGAADPLLHAPSHLRVPSQGLP
jgi:hypothetical protein